MEGISNYPFSLHDRRQKYLESSWHREFTLAFSKVANLVKRIHTELKSGDCRSNTYTKSYHVMLDIAQDRSEGLTKMSTTLSLPTIFV